YFLLGIDPRLTLLGENEVAHNKSVDARAHEALISISRAADYRLTAHIERSINNHRNTRDPLELFDQIIVERVLLSRHCLHAPRAVLVRDCREQVALVCEHIRHKQHERTIAIQIEVAAHRFAQDRRSEGTKPLAEFDLAVDYILHLRIARVGENRARSESARPELHSTLEPSHNFIVRYQSSSTPQH